MGDPTQDLPYAKREAEQVAELFGVQSHWGAQATKAAIQPKLVDKDIIHLACHGYFRPDYPLGSSITFADHRLNAREIMSLRLQAELVTLSVCESGLSEVSQGDELTGLTRALLYAGASSVLVSLWAVNDASTGELMTNFYRRLYDANEHKTKTKIKAIALQEAMLELREKKGHLYYWAPFILVGDWR